MSNIQHGQQHEGSVKPWGGRRTPLPALVALVHVFAAVPAHPRVGGDGRAAPRALQGLRGRLVILVEIRKFDHEVRSHDGQRQIDLHLRLAWGQLDFFSFVPTSRPGKREESGGFSAGKDPAGPRTKRSQTQPSRLQIYFKWDEWRAVLGFVSLASVLT